MLKIMGAGSLPSLPRIECALSFPEVMANLLQDVAMCNGRSSSRTHSRPASMQAMQLQALRAELQAAEATVAELKRLIAELESQ